MCARGDVFLCLLKERYMGSAKLDVRLLLSLLNAKRMCMGRDFETRRGREGVKVRDGCKEVTDLLLGGGSIAEGEEGSDAGTGDSSSF